jgi:hypothetical protein
MPTSAMSSRLTNREEYFVSCVTRGDCFMPYPTEQASVPYALRRAIWRVARPN